MTLSALDPSEETEVSEEDIEASIFEDTGISFTSLHEVMPAKEMAAVMTIAKSFFNPVFFMNDL